ncbi:MAG: hypothetical protein FWD47_09555 [Treponema sp.]|nr:hypothetical protein [Treponema sp.]
MSKKVVKEKVKSQKKERAEKRAKQRKLIIAGICVSIAVISGLLIFIIYNVNQNKVTEIYSYHGQTIQLLDDGKFTAVLAHNVRKSGTYTKTNENDRIIVTFNNDGRTETGWIVNDSLHIPREWDDGHGHGNVFPKIK